MPRVSNEEPQTASSHPNYFNSLTELDEWTSEARDQSGLLEGLLAYTPRSKIEGVTDESRGNLLVCHDYKGGYTESPASLAYTFNFWDQCETFIYFSHRRVTIPPPGWVNAAHRHGAKILGVLIFEHQDSVEDTLRLLIGKLPKSRTGTPAALINNGLPVSNYYARLLASLARERGFDGYLVNCEFPFPGRSEQVRAVEAWTNILNAEVKSKIGDYAQVIWFDSIVPTGDVRWQDRLNSRNLSFFLASDALFTNYFWPAPYPALTAQYLLGLAPELFQGSNKTLRDVYIGIDVWGRASHGGGGFGAFRAAEHIDPAGLGLSLGLFGPGWTWESDEGREGWNWDEWWRRERTLWVGPAIKGAHVEVPDAPVRQGEEPCTHGEFRPFSDFFQSKPPPNPDVLTFCTTFCPGVGYAWFVEGRRVMHKASGWTDVDRQTSLGNLLWPRPTVGWEGSDDIEEVLPKATSSLTFDDAFNSGSSVTVNLAGEGNSETKEPSFRCFWIPIQSMALTRGGLYEMELVYRVSSDSGEFDLALSVKGPGHVEMEITPLSSTEFEGGWSKLSITCRPATVFDGDSKSDILANVGIILAAAFDDGSLPYTIDIHLGQLSVFTKPILQDLSPYRTALLWADCALENSSSPSSSSNSSMPPLTLVLSWEACISYTSPATVSSADLDPEVPRSPWTLDHRHRAPGPHWFPRLQYANIYMESRTTASGVRPAHSALFLGTSGWGCGARAGGGSGGPNCFVLDRSTLPEELQQGAVRFYVQGVMDQGTVLSWDSCAFVDFDW